jgi:predicted thioesterase
MIRLMETACFHTLQPFCDDGEITVGISIRVEHRAASGIGMRIRAQAELESFDGRFYTMRVTADDGSQEIGRGTVGRAVVHVPSFLERMREKATEKKRRESKPNRMLSLLRPCKPKKPFISANSIAVRLADTSQGPLLLFLIHRSILLGVHQSHHVFGVARAGGCSEGEDFVNTAQIVGVKLDIQRANVLFQIFAALGARDGHDVATLRHDPCQRQLRRLAILLARHVLDSLHKVEILSKVFSLKTRREAPVVVGGEIVELLELTGEKAAA